MKVGFFASTSKHTPQQNVIDYYTIPAIIVTGTQHNCFQLDDLPNMKAVRQRLLEQDAIIVDITNRHADAIAVVQMVIDYNHSYSLVHVQPIDPIPLLVLSATPTYAEFPLWETAKVKVNVYGHTNQELSSIVIGFLKEQEKKSEQQESFPNKSFNILEFQNSSATDVKIVETEHLLNCVYQFNAFSKEPRMIVNSRRFLSQQSAIDEMKKYCGSSPFHFNSVGRTSKTDEYESEDWIFRIHKFEFSLEGLLVERPKYKSRPFSVLIVSEENNIQVAQQHVFSLLEYAIIAAQHYIGMGDLVFREDFSKVIPDHFNLALETRTLTRNGLTVVVHKY